MKPWRTISRNVILDRKPFLTVEERCVVPPNGEEIDDWTWLDTPDYVVVVAVDTNETFVVLEHTKYALKGPVIAPVGGYIETGEEPITAARRELLEETGYTAPDWIFLGDFITDGNRGNGRGYYFLARQARKNTGVVSNDLEEHAVKLLHRQQLESLVAGADMREVTAQAAFSMALLRMFYSGSTA